jgi:relaxase-like protein/conjugative element/phage-associated large polyvalent protein/DNA relaxase TraI-like protein
MIGKVMTLRKRRAAKGGFREAVNYIARDGPDDPPQNLIPSSDMGVINLDADLETAEDRTNVWSAMNATALRSQRLKGTPVYHLSLSWQEDEHPDREQVSLAVRHVMFALGMAECEALWAIHRDTDNDHVHLVVNRVHPERATVAGPPWRDYLVIGRAMREIELAQGWRHAPGPDVVYHPENADPQIVRLSRSERRALGLLKETAISQRAHWASHNLGAPSFQEWVAADPARALAQAVEASDANWASIQKTAAEFGLRLKTKGSGMIITSRLGDRLVAAKASQLGRWASKGALEKRLGPFHASDLDVKPTQRAYAEFLTSRQQGQMDVRRVSDPGDDMQRQARREARAQDRAELYERFCRERQIRASRRREARLALRARQRQEREHLSLASRGLRAEFRARRQATGASPIITAALCSFLRAQEKEVMRKRHASERVALSRRIPGTPVWRPWLERQASQGDEAAKAALRGIRYWERRKNHQNANGIEGEELDPLRPLLAGLRAEVDQRGMRVQYRDDQGSAWFSDTGPRVDVHDMADEVLKAALQVAAEKFGGSVAITGSSEFREKAARIAARLGIGVRDEDLKSIWRIQCAREKAKIGVSNEGNLSVGPVMPGSALTR